MPKEFKPAQAFDEGKPLPIAMTAVDSSQVKSIGYCPETKTLACVFARGPGHVYQYPNVSPEQHAAFIGAESIGTHFGLHIKALPFKKYPAPVLAGEQQKAA